MAKSLLPSSPAMAGFWASGFLSNEAGFFEDSHARRFSGFAVSYQTRGAGFF
jgi:hypothetical protein